MSGRGRGRGRRGRGRKSRNNSQSGQGHQGQGHGQHHGGGGGRGGGRGGRRGGRGRGRQSGGGGHGGGWRSRGAAPARRQLKLRQQNSAHHEYVGEFWVLLEALADLVGRSHRGVMEEEVMRSHHPRALEVLQGEATWDALLDQLVDLQGVLLENKVKQPDVTKLLKDVLKPLGDVLLRNYCLSRPAQVGRDELNLRAHGNLAGQFCGEAVDYLALNGVSGRHLGDFRRTSRRVGDLSASTPALLEIMNGYRNKRREGRYAALAEALSHPELGEKHNFAMAEFVVLEALRDAVRNRALAVERSGGSLAFDDGAILDLVRLAHTAAKEHGAFMHRSSFEVVRWLRQVDPARGNLPHYQLPAGERAILVLPDLPTEVASPAGDSRAALSAELMARYSSSKMTEQGALEREHVISVLTDQLQQQKFNERSVLVVNGSCAAGLANNNSDLDLGVLNAPLRDRLMPETLLRKLARSLKDESEFRNQVTQILTARVPIIKAVHRHTKVDCDIGMASIGNGYKSGLLRSFVQVDPRVAPLISTVKAWTKAREIGDASQGTLNSFGHTLLTIVYLQSVQPPVLPCLQRGYASYGFDPYTDYEGFGQQNTQSLGELFAGYFEWFLGSFDHETMVASVRRGGLVSRDKVPLREDQHKVLCIEDPFDATDNVARNIHDTIFELIWDEFDAANRALDEGATFAELLHLPLGNGNTKQARSSRAADDGVEPSDEHLKMRRARLGKEVDEDDDVEEAAPSSAAQDDEVEELGELVAEVVKLS